jgi:crotonobetainyl-CoA:carnitine CoA-transferase CaiB-like acyl-CoA transferase
MTDSRRSGALAGITVLERARGVAAAYSGRLLATLGAEVVMVESPGGSPLRSQPPYLDRLSGKSALFAYLAAGKRSEVCDDANGLDRKRFDALLASADILLDDTPIDERSKIGLDPHRLKRDFPHLIFVSVLPFGAVGPHARWRAEEINILHAGGEGALLPNGLAFERFPDRPPVKIYGNFGMYQGGVSAAIAAVAALLARPAVGGQFVDISVQDANVAVGAFAFQRLGEGVVEHRKDRSFRYGGVMECDDGFVEILTLESGQWRGLRALMGDPEWAAAPELEDSLERARQGAAINAHIRAWSRKQAVADVVANGQRFGVPVARYNSPAEVLSDPHERARGLFQSIDVFGSDPVDMLVAPFKLTDTPAKLASGPSDIGRRSAEAKRPAPVAPPNSPLKESASGPLQGVRIADFTLHAAGPFCTHILSLLGAQCIKIESSLRPDIFRRPHPVYGRLGAASFDQVSSNKLSVTLNLKDPRGIDLAKRIVAISDVAAESFRPGVMTRLGLGFEMLQAIKPELVMVSVSASGQTGPDKNYSGYAPLFSAWGGLGYMTGYPDGPPVEIRHVMDHSVGLTAAFATIAAIFHKRMTGRGQHVDVAAREVASSFVGEALLQCAFGQTPTRIGNKHLGMAPHGVYPCRAPDSWISIAVSGDKDWEGLAAVLGRPEWLRQDLYSTTAGRVAHAAALDQMLADATRMWDAGELAERLQKVGVPAVPAWSTADLAADNHLRERGALMELRRPDGTSRDVVGAPFLFSKCSNNGVERWTPDLGEHNEMVFGEILGMSDGERLVLVEEGVIK